MLIGTRFVATKKSRVPAFYKEALRTHDSDSTVITDAFSGLYARVIRNAFTTEYAQSEAPVLTGYLQSSVARDVVVAASERADSEYYPMWAGQGIGMIKDLPAAADVMAALIRESGEAFVSMNPRLRG